ncbi:hypothetical protein VPHD81_0069 [Vibrio phage D81]
MSILNIRQAKRSGSKVVIGVAGPSGSGKTLTALYIAEGLASHPSKIGMLDTENKRGELYADELSAPFLIGDLYPPFSPERYADSIKEFQEAGVEVLVIDSVTHEWEGTGGCIEIADAAGKLGWNQGKSRHKKFMNVLLQSNMHIIVCVRAREQMDFRNPSKPISLGIQPVQEKNFMYEMTASVLMFDEGKYQQHLKMPKALKAAFGDPQGQGGHNGYIGIDQGRAIREWVESGETIDEELEKWKSAMQLETENGVESLQAAWKKMPKAVIKAMKPFYSNYEQAAKAYDEQGGTANTVGKFANDFEDDQAFNPMAAALNNTEQTTAEPEVKPETDKVSDDQAMIDQAAQAQAQNADGEGEQKEPECF